MPAPVLKDIHPIDSPADTHERINSPPISELRNAKRIEMTFMTVPPRVVASTINGMRLQILLRVYQLLLKKIGSLGIAVIRLYLGVVGKEPISFQIEKEALEKVCDVG